MKYLCIIFSTFLFMCSCQKENEFIGTWKLESIEANGEITQIDNSIETEFILEIIELSGENLEVSGFSERNSFEGNYIVDEFYRVNDTQIGATEVFDTVLGDLYIDGIYNAQVVYMLGNDLEIEGQSISQSNGYILHFYKL